MSTVKVACMLLCRTFVPMTVTVDVNRCCNTYNTNCPVRVLSSYVMYRCTTWRSNISNAMRDHKMVLYHLLLAASKDSMYQYWLWVAMRRVAALLQYGVRPVY